MSLYVVGVWGNALKWITRANVTSMARSEVRVLATSTT